MAKPKKVILWGQNDLLTQAMEMFLKSDETETWEVIRCPADGCISMLVEQVQKIRPDLVILYQAQSGDECDPLIKMILEQPELHVLADQPQSKIITVSLQNNVLRVYRKHSITVRNLSDLLSIVEDRYFSENPI